jgi:hypothetical protein
MTLISSHYTPINVLFCPKFGALVLFILVFGGFITQPFSVLEIFGLLGC